MTQPWWISVAFEATRCIRAALIFSSIHMAVGAAPPQSIPYQVRPQERAQLQSLLNVHHSIRLEANQDYRSAGVSQLRVKSDMRIIGGWNTRIPQLFIEAGSSNIVIDSVRTDAKTSADVVFGSGTPIHDVSVVGGNGGPGTWIRVEVPAGAHLDHIQVTDFGGLSVEQQASGYIRNSTFSRLLGYWPGPHVSWSGNKFEHSYGNAFLGMFSITPQSGSRWKQPGDFWIVNADCESWNMHDRSQNQCFRIEDAAHVFSAGLSGGTAFPDRDGALATIQDTSGFVSWSFHGSGGVRDGSDLRLVGVKTAAFFERAPTTRLRDDAAQSDRVRLNFGAAVNAESDPTGPQSLATQEFLDTLAANPPPLNRTKPSLRVLKFSNAAPPGRRADKTDASAVLQQRIDAEGVVKLPAGIYYLDRPLRIGSVARTEGLLGTDEESVILAPKGNFPAITGRGDFDTPKNAEAVLVSLAFDRITIDGGSDGIEWSAAPGNFGQGVTVAFSNFSNLHFLRQTRAGVRVRDIHGIDSNSWIHDDFSDMPVAFDGAGHGTSGPMGYADKQAFIDCQFQGITQSVWSWSSDRPSGGELWQDDFFSQVGELSRTKSATSLLWANSVMENVTGDSAIHVLDQGDTATYYFYLFDCVWQGLGPKVVSDSLSFGLGTLFIANLFEQRGGSLVSRAGSQSASVAFGKLPDSMLPIQFREFISAGPDAAGKAQLTVIHQP